MENDTLNALQQLRASGKFVSGWDNELVNQAFNLANISHRGQRRRTGEEYIVHVLGVAKLVADLHCDLETILSALLHDVVEDTEVGLNQIEAQFGTTTAITVDALTNLPRDPNSEDASERDARNLRKTIVGAASNLRVAYIKLADRLHNLERRDPAKPKGSTRSSREAWFYYIPLAGELGIRSLQRRLGQHCLEYERPDLKKELAMRAKLNQDEFNQLVNRLSFLAREKLRSNGIEKTRYVGRSLFESLLEQYFLSQGLGYDLFEHWHKRPIQISLSFDSLDNCYAALRVIHENWNVVPGKFLDSTFSPLPNGYRAIHTMVKTDKNELILFVLQTFEMYRDSELGPLQKIVRAMNYDQERNQTQQETLLQSILELDRSIVENDPDLFLEFLRLDILRSKIRVFSPNQDMIIIPNGSTIVDLVFWTSTPREMAIHLPLVNGNIAGLDWKLKDGDIVTFTDEILDMSSFSSFWKKGQTHVTARAHYGMSELGII